MLQNTVDEFIASLTCGASGLGDSKRNTAMAYRNDLKQLCRFLMELHISTWSQVTHEHIAAYLADMRDGQAYRSTTIARKLATLKAFFRYVYHSGMITSDPSVHFNLPPIERGVPLVLSPEQINHLFEQVEYDTPVGLRDLAMLHILYSTGLRTSELISLNLDHFDAERGVIVCPGRYGVISRDRVLPLSFECFEVMLHYLEHSRLHFIRHPGEVALFLNCHGERLTRQGFWLILKGHARRSGIIALTPHVLRSSFALMMLQDGMELSSVQELLGHAHLSTTQLYCQLVRDDNPPL